MEKIKALLKKLLTREFILYVVFGVVTTLVNLVVFWALNTLLGVHHLVATPIAWVVAVAVAYVTNRLFVFESRTRGRAMVREIALFLGARLLSLGVDELSMYVLVDLLLMNATLAKLVANVLVIIINYILSKFLIFRSKKDG